MSRSLHRSLAGEEAPRRGRSMENGLEEEEEEEEEEEILDEEDASRLEKFMRDRRRARSLPACLLEGVPGGNGRKKSVKFADALGMSLASVKHFSTLEEPQIPSKVLSRHRSFPPQQQELLGELQGFRAGVGAGAGAGADSDRLVACFPEPREAERRAQRLRVCLEGLSITRFDVRGQIRVLDGSPDKEVGVRYTFNEWLSHVDAQALPVAAEPPPAAGSAGERFAFTVYTPPFMDPSSAVHFAVFLRSERGEFWDNNEGRNYSLRYRCMAASDAHFVSAAFHAT